MMTDYMPLNQNVNLAADRAAEPVAEPRPLPAAEPPAAAPAVGVVARVRAVWKFLMFFSGVLLVVLAIIYHYAFVSVLMAPCRIPGESANNPFLGLNLEALQGIILDTNIESAGLRGILDRLFDYEMEQLVEFDSTPKDEKPKVPDQKPSEPYLITYFRDRLKMCEEQKPVPCKPETILYILQQIDLHLREHPESPQNKRKLPPVASEIAIHKRNQINSLSNKLSIIRPVRGCTPEIAKEWETISNALLATWERLHHVIGVLQHLEAEATVFFRGGRKGTDAWRRDRYQ